MTPQQAQAQALIHEIDSVLHKANPRLPWVMSNEDAQQRQLLQQLRTYLVTSLQVSSPSPAIPEDRSRGVAVGEARSGSVGASPDRTGEPSMASMGQLDAMQQTLHAMMQEMNHLRSTVLQPLQADVAGLQQQREFLRQEVQHLESQKQAAIAPATTTTEAALSQQVLQEVLQLLMQRLQESLSQQISQQINQSFQRLQATLQPAYDLPPASATPALLSGMGTEQVQNLEALQSRADQVLTTIDTTLRVVFESMQRNLESYQESLTRGLERMHGLGQQSEAQFAALLNHLAQRLGQEASTYLQASLQTQGLIAPEAPADREAVRPTGAVSPVALPTEPIAEETLPFAGSELGGGSAGVARASTQPRAAMSTPAAQRSETLQLEDLDLSDFNLDALDTSLIDAEGIDLEALPSVTDTAAAWPLELEAEDLGTGNLGPEALGTQTLEAESVAAKDRASRSEATTEAAATDFLNQLAETFDAPPLAREDDSPPAGVTPTSWTGGSTTAELRELYQSLFGSDEFTGPPPVASPSVSSEAIAPSNLPPAATPATAAANLPTLDNLFGGLDATIHPDSFDLDTFDTEPSPPETRLSELSELSEQEGPATTRPTPEAERATDRLDTPAEQRREPPSSLEDFFFPDAASASTAPVPPLPDDDEVLSLAAMTEADAEAADWLEGAVLEMQGEEAPTGATSRTAPADLPDLDTDPFNLGALAADFSDLSDTSNLSSLSQKRSEAGEAEATSPDLADLLADLGTPEATAAGLSPIDVGASSPTSAEDSFDAAAPDEDLLAAEDLQATASPDLLQINDQTLQQLSEDLFSLESGEFAATGTPLTPEASAVFPLSPTPPMAAPMPAPQPPADLPPNLDDADRLEVTADSATRTTEFGVEAFAADLFGEFDAEEPRLAPSEAEPDRGALSTTDASARDLDTDPSLAVLEDLFADPTPNAPAAGPVPTATPRQSDGGLLDDLFADFGDLDVASKTAENNLASFQAEFPALDTDDAAKKKF